jgi:branched-chain amino acid transport system substrate-binding protein
VIQDDPDDVHDKGQGTGPKEEVGQVLYMRGAMSAMLGVEGVRRAQERFGKGKVMTGEQVRWGLENLRSTRRSSTRSASRRDAADQHLVPDHMGAPGRACTPGTAASGTSLRLAAGDEQIIKPMVKAAATSTRREEADARTPATASPELPSARLAAGSARAPSRRRAEP